MLKQGVATENTLDKFLDIKLMLFIPRMCVQLLSRTCKSHKSHALKAACGVWSAHRAVFLTSELSERGVWLQVKTLPVLIEGLHAELAGLLNGSHGHFGHHSIDVMASANL